MGAGGFLQGLLGGSKGAGGAAGNAPKGGGGNNTAVSTGGAGGSPKAGKANAGSRNRSPELEAAATAAADDAKSEAQSHVMGKQFPSLPSSS